MLHNDCDSGACVACYLAEKRAKGQRCDTCYWWLRDSLSDGQGICRRYRPSRVETTDAEYSCREHSFDRPLDDAQMPGRAGT